ncbi:hypothetical protein C8R46DRAFT_1258041, partial [Mycena filopes]
RAGKNDKRKDGTLNPHREATMAMRALASGDVIKSSSFALADDASVSPRGWQGRLPPQLARDEIRVLFRKKPDAEALYPWLKHFIPIPYEYVHSVANRATFVVDSTGLIFLHRSFQATWLADRIDEIEEAQAILVENDLQSPSLRKHFENEVRGPHMAIIFGHQRQSSKRPYLAEWGRDHQDRVTKFMELPIVKDIIGWVSSIIRRVWPGLAARFEADAAWHYERYQIQPMFGLYWNFCWNATFPEQDRTHTDPHCDYKNQIGCCSILTYLLKSGANFNHKLRTWLVLWEANIALELPPWTLTSYPSSLFYHFNLDVHRLKFVCAEEDIERPTPENSREIVAGDTTGRGSMVFFSQSTMRQGPVTGCDTVEQAMAAGHEGVMNPHQSVEEAFRRSGS